MTRLSPSMRRALVELSEGRDPVALLHGRSEHGGWSRNTRPALISRGLMTPNCEITDAGRAAVVEMAAEASRSLMSAMGLARRSR